MKQKKPLSSYVEMLRTMIAILISLIIVFAIILLISSQPLSALGDFIFGPLTSVRRFGNVIEGMTPLMFTGLAVIILFKPGLFNLSMEGAFFIGAVAACAASLGLGFSGKTALIVAMAAAAVAGGFICFIPGIMKVKTGSNELVTSLMLNYTCLYVGLPELQLFLQISGRMRFKQDHHRHAYQLRYDHRPCDCPCDLGHRKPDTLRL